VPVVAGATDGLAGCLASGAKEPGDLNVTLGTTLIFKAISPQPLLDPDGVVYNHRHPAGGYLPGAASSSGAEWVEAFFRGEDLERLGREAAARLPTRQTVYPLVKTGERFPFARATAAGFGWEQIDDPVARFAAGMEGTAFLERLGIDRLEHVGLRIGPTVYATGGAVAGETWLRIRAAISGRTFSVPQYPQCAVGAAVLAAMPHLGGCREAVAALVRAGRMVEPEPRLAATYSEPLERFRTALRERGWL
jgi:sugar (pentulose or hexulose) kinase